MEPPTSATDRVFGTYELLELILSSCDAFTVLVSISVCRYWRGLILDSRILRRHMSIMQPPASLPHSLATSEADDGRYQLISRNDYPWCFRTPALQGTLWVLRIPPERLESFLLVPHSPKRPLMHLSTATCSRTLLAARRAWRYDPHSYRPQSPRDVCPPTTRVAVRLPVTQ